MARSAETTGVVDQPGERSPLLGAYSASSPSNRSPSPPTQQQRQLSPTHDTSQHDGGNGETDLRSQLRTKVVLLSLVILFLLELGVGTTQAPVNAVMESSICRHLHPEVFLPPQDHTIVISPVPNFPVEESSGGKDTAGHASLGSIAVAEVRRGVLRHFEGGVILVDDPICKSPEVQGYLAMLKGWDATFNCVPGMIAAMPYGVLSDRWGRKPVLGLSVFGLVLTQASLLVILYFSDILPLWSIWLANLCQLIGGGGTVFSAMVYTLVADVVPVAERATVFFWVAAVYLSALMVSGPLAGVLMESDPWIPLLLSLAVLILANLVATLVPETVHVHDKHGNGEEGANRASESDSADQATLSKLVDKAQAGLADVWTFILSNLKLTFLMLSLTFVILGRFVGELLLQYATERYGYTWGEASAILSIRSVSSLATLLVILPAASRFCLGWLGMSGLSKDLWLSRVSGVVQLLGALMIAAAADRLAFVVGLIIFSLGFGLSSLIRSLLNALVEEHHVGTVNTLVGFMEMVGLVITGPLLAENLKLGLKLGGGWVGLPFITAAGLFLVSTTILCIFRLPGREDQAAVEVEA